MRALQAYVLSAATAIVVIFVMTKAAIVNASTLNGAILVPGFLDISFVRNRGISFGLLAQNGPLGIAALVVLAAILIVTLSVWVYRMQRTVSAAGAGIIIGGASANMLDRAMHGSVFDFLALHLGAFPLFVCNAPDIAISLGVVILLADQIFMTRPKERRPS